MISKIYTSKVNYKRILLHVLFWILLHIYVAFIYILSQEGRTFNISAIIETFFGSVLLIPGNYLIIYYLLPKFVLQQRKYFLFIILYVIIMIAATLADPLIYIHLYIPNFRPEVLELYKTYAFKITFLVRLFYSKNIEIILFFSVKFLIEYLKGYFNTSKIKTEILNTELRMLQSQLHPHFLFNTLNNIYFLLMDEKKELVHNTIDKIRNILNYSVNECNTNTIELGKELKIINDYIELERLRHSNLEVELNFPNKTDNIYVLPLSLFTLVENSFKHGISKSINHKWLKANLNISKGEFCFTVMNSKINSKKNDEYGYSKGIGLKNLKDRLELFVGRENFSFETIEIDNYFKAELKCKLL